jgi:hypothetical protein
MVPNEQCLKVLSGLSEGSENQVGVNSWRNTHAINPSASPLLISGSRNFILEENLSKLGWLLMNGG